MAQAVEEQLTPVRGAKLWPMTVEAYHLLGEAGIIPEKTELLYGLVYTKMPKSPYHSFLVRRLFEMLQKLELRGVFVSTEQPITIGDSEPEPDVAVIKGSNDQYRTSHPTTAELAIEICVTSHDYDRSKLRAYAQGGVKECWLILGPEKAAEVFTSPSVNGFQKSESYSAGAILTSKAAPEITVDLNALFEK